jgi:HKD family nuclease
MMMMMPRRTRSNEILRDLSDHLPKGSPIAFSIDFISTRLDSGLTDEHINHLDVLD